jgi:putative ABC transport system permease protein
VAEKLFPGKPEQIVDAVIRVGAMPYRVVGLLKAKGSSMGRVDDIIVTSYNNARKYNGAGPSFFIGVIVNNVTDLDRATSEATAAFRGVRQLQPMDADNFVIEKSDKFAELFIGFLSGISALAIIIGFITLIGAAIGLMNIMLVAVNERTREVGLIKSIGGKSQDIRRQFLFESIIISLLGALFGIIAGILVGNLVAMALDTGFIVPWGWVIFGVVVCALVGLIAGIYPAVKAGKLDPIVALRYE